MNLHPSLAAEEAEALGRVVAMFSGTTVGEFEPRTQEEDGASHSTVLQEADDVLADMREQDRWSLPWPVVEAKADATPPGWLIEGLWPQDAYGVMGGADKSGKTWAALDLAVSVATGTPWLGRFGVSTGGVLYLAGEGGARNLRRRVDAICRGRGLDREEVSENLRVRLMPLDLTDMDQVRELNIDLAENPTTCVFLDPLYLSTGRASSKDLAEMGAVLRGLQVAAQRAGAACVVVTHWNKTGNGTGPERFTGVGAGAWGRVLMSFDARDAKLFQDTTSEVPVNVQVSGSEVASHTFHFVRRIRAADPIDLTSPMDYEVEVVDSHMVCAVGTRRPALGRFVEALSGDWQAAAAIAEALRVTHKTAARNLRDAANEGLCERQEQGKDPRTQRQLPDLFRASRGRPGTGAISSPAQADPGAAQNPSVEPG